MSSFPSDQPTGAPPRLAPQVAGRPRLESLRRYDIEADPNHGSLLYQAVVAQDTTQLTGDGWLDRLEAIARLKSRLAALEAETVAGFDDSLHGTSADLGHRHPEPGDRAATAGERRWIAGDLRSVSDEIALILEMRRGHATTRIHTACELVHNFPATLHALTEGLLTERAAFTIVNELSILDDLDEIRAAETAILDWARTHRLVDIKQACQREVARRSPAATDKAHQRAHDERSVRMHTNDHGRADLVHDHDTVDVAAVMTSLSRAAVYRRRHGDTRTMDQLRNDIALSRLLPRTKRTSNTPDADLDVNVDAGAGSGSGAGAGAGAGAGEAVAAYEAADDTRPGHDSSDLDPDPPSDRDLSIDRDLAPGPDADAVDEAVVGADATVVIHATGAEVRALIDGEEGTGGEADHHGPIPQSSLRKHLIKALTQTLLPNLPTTPNSSHPGATVRRARTTTTRTTTTGAETSTATGPTGGSTRSGSRIELQITDRPPPSHPNRYTPSPALDRYIRLRDRTCCFPGCNRPAEFTDLDHRTAFNTGGRTTAANLWCLCRHHHRLKHEGGWHLHPNPDGTHTWTSPTGRRYTNNNPTDPGPRPTPHDRLSQQQTIHHQTGPDPDMPREPASLPSAVAGLVSGG